MAATLAISIGASDAVHAKDLSLPIGSNCARVTSFSLVETEDAGNGWVRGYVVETLFRGSGTGKFRIWDARCADNRLAEAAETDLDNPSDGLKAARQLAGSISVGEGNIPDLYCVRDPKLAVTARAICEQHAQRNKAEEKQ